MFHIFALIVVWKPDHPKAHDGRVKRSRLVLEQRLDRYLLDEYVPHHSNGNKLDDRSENLEEMSLSYHMRWHREQKKHKKGRTS